MSLSMQEILPDGGLASFQNEVSKLADLGRYEDAYIVHAAEGETIVPMAVFDENPRLKAMLFAQMRGMGIDPQRYIVGSEFNSINPITGQPEFFLKKIFKEAKKAVKKLAPYAGTIAGIAGMGPWASAAIGAGVPLLMGEDMSAAIAGGLGGYGAGSAMGTAKMFGGKGDDYALAKLFGDQGGIGPAFNQVKRNLGFGASTNTAGLSAEASKQLGVEQGTLIKDLSTTQKKDLQFLMDTGVIKSPVSAAATNWAPWLKAGSAFAPAIIEGLKQDDSPMGMPHGWDNIYPSSPWYGNWAAPGTIDAMAAGNADGGIIQKFENGGDTTLTPGQRAELEHLVNDREWEYDDAYNYVVSLDLNTGGIVQLAEGTGPRGVHPGTDPKEKYVEGWQELSDLIDARNKLLGGTEEDPRIQNLIDARNKLLGGTEQEGYQFDFDVDGENRTYSFDQQGLTDQARRAFLTREGITGEIPDDQTMSSDEYQEELIRRAIQSGIKRGQGIVAVYDRENGKQFALPEDNAMKLVLQNSDRFVMVSGFEGMEDITQNKDTEYTESKYADGGIAHLSAGAFPRMTGAIAGPGGPKDDMVPAMLSDGEFVMTADAVRNAGGGSRREGARRMYQLMNQLEQGAMV